MGGYGSSRWAGYWKKAVVEDCRWLDVNRWMREGIIAPGHWRAGGWIWMDAQTGETTSSIGYEVRTQEASGWVRLRYTFKSGPNNGQAIDYKIPLVTTSPHLGGVRWWFVCPGRRCGGRRVGKLYLPYGQLYFLCRHCHDLAYRSSQEHDKTRDRYRRLDFETLLAMMTDEEGGLANIHAAREILERGRRWR